MAHSRIIADCPDYADAELGAVARMLLDGKSEFDISVELDLSTDETRAIIKRIRSIGGGEPRKRKPPVTIADRTEIMRMHVLGVTQAEIAMHTRKPESTVRYVIESERDA